MRNSKYQASDQDVCYLLIAMAFNAIYIAIFFNVPYLEAWLLLYSIQFVNWTSSMFIMLHKISVDIRLKAVIQFNTITTKSFPTSNDTEI